MDKNLKYCKLTYQPQGNLFGVQLSFTLDKTSDRVRGCGNAQFSQTRTISHNIEKFALILN